MGNMAWCSGKTKPWQAAAVQCRIVTSTSWYGVPARRWGTSSAPPPSCWHWRLVPMADATPGGGGLALLLPLLFLSSPWRSFSLLSVRGGSKGKRTPGVCRVWSGGSGFYRGQPLGFRVGRGTGTAGIQDVRDSDAWLHLVRSRLGF
jgi:hypothetical protein